MNASVAVRDAAAVLTARPDGWQTTDHWQLCTPAKAVKTLSPSAVYAEQAAALLPEIPQESGLICLSGPTGMTVDVFDRAVPKEGGPLVSESFGASRYKRIHPFTLVRSLQNQAASHLSMRFGLKGPCLNLIDSASALALVPLHAAAMLQRLEAVLLVLTAAPDRGEEAAKHRALFGQGVLVEGSAAFLLTRHEGVGYIGRIHDPSSKSVGELHVDGKPVITPIVREGWQLYEAFARALPAINIALNDGAASHETLAWRKDWPS